MSEAIINRRRSARVMSRKAQSAEKLTTTDEAITEKDAKLSKPNVKTKKDAIDVPKRRESLAQRILRQNNNLLGDSGSERHDSTFEATTTGDDDTMEEMTDDNVYTENSSESDEEDRSFANFTRRQLLKQPLPARKSQHSLARCTKSSTVKAAFSALKPTKKVTTARTRKHDGGENSDAEADENAETGRFSKFSTAFLTNCLDRMNRANNLDLTKLTAGFDTESDALRFTASSMQPAGLEAIKEDDESSTDGDGDADEWLEMERIDEAVMGDRAKASVQVTIKAPVKKTKEQLEAERWMNEIRLEIARRRRALYLNMHRTHILCFIGHLRFHVNAVIQSQAVLADVLSNVLSADVLAFCPAAMDKAVQAFRALFRVCSAQEARAIFAEALENGGEITKKSKKQKTKKTKRSEKATPSDTVVAAEIGEYAHIRTADCYGRYLTAMIAHKLFTSNLDLSVIFFAFCHCVLKLTARLCVSCCPMPKVEPKRTDDKPNDTGTDIEQKPSSSSTATALSKSKVRTRSASSNIAGGSPSKPLLEAAKSDAIAAKRRMSVGGDTTVKKPPKRSSIMASDAPLAMKTPKMPRASASSSFSVAEPDDIDQLTPRNYWVEFYDDVERRWICVDPTFSVVDRPKKIEKHAGQPMLYVFVVDSEMGVREVAAKYSSDFMTTKHRRLRIEQEWLDKTLQLPPLKANRARAVAEDTEIRGIMLDRDRPSTVSEYKNHPLYVLDKDLLKFEAIYPPDLEPLGTIRGYKIFPRSAVFTLQGELNWIKVARIIKAGEKPYKVVKARPKFNIPKEERTQLYLDVYGYWQTEPYVPPPVIDGKIPRNNHGNIYLYQESMIPKGCVHLKLNGLMQVARRMDLEAVQAITGWEFSGGGNHPLIEGCVVLKKDAAVLRKAWEEFMAKKAEREAKRSEERIWNNWKKLIKGKLLLEKMRTRFA